LTVAQILQGADEFRERTGNWPTQFSGSVDGVLAETWASINGALRTGTRSLPGRSSLAKLLAEHRGASNIHDLPPLSLDQILQWIDSYFELHSHWPKKDSGPIIDAPGETWAGINWALAKCKRGVSSGFSLARLIKQHCDNLKS